MRYLLVKPYKNEGVYAEIFTRCMTLNPAQFLRVQRLVALGSSCLMDLMAVGTQNREPIREMENQKKIYKTLKFSKLPIILDFQQIHQNFQKEALRSHQGMQEEGEGRQRLKN
jgi:hypothetical protein